jgi:hypothetical protein
MVNGQFHDPFTLSPVNNPDIHSTGGWAGPRAGLDVLEEKKNLLPLRGFKLRITQLVA